MKIVKRNFEILVAAGMLLVAMLAFAYADGGFRFFGPVRRVVSPSRNDNAVFCFDNPSDSGVSGAIYSMLGSHVADFGPAQLGTPAVCPSTTIPGTHNFMTWDGKASGAAVHSGLYIYQIRAEGLSFTGALVVVR